jgi:hypothetical protein
MIQFEVDGTPGTGDMPGRMIFATTAALAETLTERMRIDSAGKISTNGGAVTDIDTGGLVLDQDTGTGGILSFKGGSDIAHGMTDVADTDTYGRFLKHGGATGGLAIQGFTDTLNRGAINMTAFHGTASMNTAKSTSGHGGIQCGSAIKSGAGQGSCGADANMMSIADQSTVRFIFDAEGSGHADVEWTTFSDGRLKKNQETLSYGLAEVNLLQPKIYDRYSGYINSNPDHPDYDDYEDGEIVLESNFRRQIGFVAQEVKEVIPELVKDVDETESWYSLDDGKLAAVLVNAIQELSAKVTALENA